MSADVCVCVRACVRVCVCARAERELFTGKEKRGKEIASDPVTVVLGE